MCQPGRPLPYLLAQNGSCGFFVAFHKAKSVEFRLSLVSENIFWNKILRTLALAIFNIHLTQTLRALKGLKMFFGIFLSQNKRYHLVKHTPNSTQPACQ
jgi:hypothetical protein